MRRQLVAINVLLLVAVLVLAERLQSGWSAFEAQNSLQRILASGGTDPEAATGPALEPDPEPVPFAEFLVVPEKNLFSPERRAPASDETGTGVEEEQPPAWAARPFLRGVTRIGGEKHALVVSFESGKSAPQMRLRRVGDLVQGYALAEIGERTVKLRWKDREEILDMADAPPAAPAQPARQATAAVKVITIGSRARAVVTSEAGGAAPAEGGGIQVATVGGQRGAAVQGQGGRIAPGAGPEVQAGANRNTPGAGRTRGRVTRRPPSNRPPTSP